LENVFVLNLTYSSTQGSIVEEVIPHKQFYFTYYCGKAPILDQAKRELAIKIREVKKRRMNNEDDEDNNYSH
jgi:hypothetical protein